MMKTVKFRNLIPVQNDFGLLIFSFIISMKAKTLCSMTKEEPSFEEKKKIQRERSFETQLAAEGHEN